MSGTRRKRLWAATLAAVMLGSIGGLVTMAGCKPSPETVAALQEDLGNAETVLTELRVELELVVDEGNAAELALAIGAIEDRVALINAELVDATADSLWIELAEAAALIACGLIPGGGIAIPFIRSARAATDSVFDSVAAGGGPATPAKAKDSLVKSPRAYKAFQTWKTRRAALAARAGA